MALKWPKSSGSLWLSNFLDGVPLVQYSGKLTGNLSATEVSIC